MITEPASSPTISGSGAVTQQGTGITVLTGNNSYGGSTAVDAGTLIVNGNQSAAAGATSVAAGATLGGACTIGGDVSVADGATLSPGNLGSVPGTLRDLLYRQAAADVAYPAMTSAFNPLGLSPRLPTTMDLLTLALEKDSLREWARKLELSEEAPRSARSRGRLSPVLAGCIAEDLQLDAERWIVIAVLETERDTAGKFRMAQRFSKAWSSMSEEIQLSPT